MLRDAAAEEHNFRGRVAGMLENAQAYDDELAQAIAASLMPLDRMEASAREAAALSLEMGEDPAQPFEEALLSQLLSWFKGEFFTWVRVGVAGLGASACLPK